MIMNYTYDIIMNAPGYDIMIDIIYSTDNIPHGNYLTEF